MFDSYIPELRRAEAAWANREDGKVIHDRSTRHARHTSESQNVSASPLVLIVEDNVDQRDLLRLNFERAGCRVQLAETAEAATIAYRETAPDLAVIDLILPGMAGEALIEQMRRECPGCAIVVTSVLDPADFPRSDGVLPKPFTRAQVEDVLATCLPNWSTHD